MKSGVCDDWQTSSDRMWSAIARKKAAVAVGHSILVISYYVIERDQPYDELGEDFFFKRQTTDAYKKRLVRQLERLGHRVTLEPLPQMALGGTAQVIFNPDLIGNHTSGSAGFRSSFRSASSLRTTRLTVLVH